MKARELKELGVDQLKEKLAQLNLDLFNYRMTAKLGNLEKPGYRLLRQDGQDDYGCGRKPQASPDVQQDHDYDQQAQGSR